MITRSIDSLESIPNPQFILKCIDQFYDEVRSKRIRLKEYYDGNHLINKRLRALGMPNMRICVTMPKYIAIMASGYLMSNPVVYKDYDNPASIDGLIEAFQNANIDAVDSELALQQSIYGVGLEVMFMDEHSNPAKRRCVTLDAFQVSTSGQLMSDLLNYEFGVNSSQPFPGLTMNINAGLGQQVLFQTAPDTLLYVVDTLCNNDNIGYATYFNPDMNILVLPGHARIKGVAMWRMTLYRLRSLRLMVKTRAWIA
ncbi:hypothetical protein AGMMS49992_25990 [Clostridia bacterium]|nr:hypothetical protein AGMMS49992_25990 [Clostridia bacterium]